MGIGRRQPHINAPTTPHYLSSAIYLGSFENQFSRSNDKSIIFLNKVRDEIKQRLGDIDSKTPFALNTGFKASFTNDPHDPWGFISDYWYRDGYLFAFIPSAKVHGAMTYGESFPAQAKKAEMQNMDRKALLDDLKSRNMLKALVDKMDKLSDAQLKNDYFKSNNLLRTIVEDIMYPPLLEVMNFNFSQKNTIWN